MRVTVRPGRASDPALGFCESAVSSGLVDSLRMTLVPKSSRCSVRSARLTLSPRTFGILGRALATTSWTLPPRFNDSPGDGCCRITTPSRSVDHFSSTTNVSPAAVSNSCATRTCRDSTTGTRTPVEPVGPVWPSGGSFVQATTESVSTAATNPRCPKGTPLSVGPMVSVTRTRGNRSKVLATFLSRLNTAPASLPCRFERLVDRTVLIRFHRHPA
jgi:hypothetical protein